jgi:hypothetical protein
MCVYLFVGERQNYFQRLIRCDTAVETRERLRVVIGANTFTRFERFGELVQAAELGLTWKSLPIRRSRLYPREDEVERILGVVTKGRKSPI